MRFLPALIVTNLRAALALRAAFWLQAAFMLLNNLSFFVIWWIFFERFEQIRGWRLEDMATLYCVVVSAFGLTVVLLGGVRSIAERITNGDLDAYLTLPANPLLHLSASRSVASGWGDLASGPVFLLAFSGVTLGELPWVLLAIACATAVFASSGILIHSTAFWLGDVDSVAQQVWELILTFALYPQTLFSGALRLLLFTLVPAGFIGHLPVELIRDPDPGRALAVLGAACGYAALAWSVFGLGLRRYTSGSRFSVRV